MYIFSVVFILCYGGFKSILFYGYTHSMVYDVGDILSPSCLRNFQIEDIFNVLVCIEIEKIILRNYFRFIFK